MSFKDFCKNQNKYFMNNNTLDPKKLEKKLENWYENYNETVYNIIGKVFILGLVIWAIYSTVGLFGNIKGFNLDQLITIITLLTLIVIVLLFRRQSKTLKRINTKLNEIVLHSETNQQNTSKNNLKKKDKVTK